MNAKATFFWVSHADGLALINMDSIQTIYWKKNHRETQTEACITMKDQTVHLVTEFPMDPVIVALKDSASIIPLQFVRAEGDSSQRDSSQT